MYDDGYFTLFMIDLIKRLGYWMDNGPMMFWFNFVKIYEYICCTSQWVLRFGHLKGKHLVNIW